MSYEKKMRDLMARLVAMSPEPPPYPDETPMASRRQLTKTRPALVFAAAAALVVVLAVPLLLFTGGGEGPDPLATTTSTTVGPDSTATTDVPSSTSTTTPTFEPWSGVVFLYNQPENSFTGYPALVPVAVTIDSFSVVQEDVDFFQALAILSETVEELPPGLDTAVPSDVFVQSTRTEGERIVADMNEAFLEGAGGTAGDFTMLNQLVYTLTDGNEDGEVLFTVNGEPVTAFGGNGLDLTEPLRRDTYLDPDQQQLHLINLTSPIVPQDDASYLVEGIANVYEGSLMVRVLETSGEVVHEEPVQAACGTGCWGDFTVALAGDLIVPGETSIQVFTNSAEDGSMVDIVTIPILDGNVWRINVEG